MILQTVLEVVIQQETKVRNHLDVRSGDVQATITDDLTAGPPSAVVNTLALDPELAQGMEESIQPHVRRQLRVLCARESFQHLRHCRERVVTGTGMVRTSTDARACLLKINTHRLRRAPVDRVDGDP